MIDIGRIIAVGIVGVFLSVIVKRKNQEFAVAISIATSLVIFFMVSDTLYTFIYMIQSIAERANVDFVYFETILKIIGIVYLTQLASSVAKDAGEGAISSKIEFGGKMCIVALSAPILLSLLNLIVTLIP